MRTLIIHINNRTLLNKVEYKEVMNNLKDGKYLITVKDLRKRSLPQNSYYWGVVVPLIKSGLREAGFDDVKTNDDAHLIIKHIHLKKEIVSKSTGEVIDIAGSTTDLNVPEFMEFLDRVCKWSAEYLGVMIPIPNEY